MQFLGLLLSLLGVVVLITGGKPTILFTLEFNKGDLFMIGACLCYAFYVLHLVKKLDMPPVIMLTFFSFSALMTLTVFAVGEYALGHLIMPSKTGWLIVLFVAVFPSILSQTFFMRGVELLGANRAGLYVNLVPVFAAFMAVVLLSESIHGYHIGALLMVIAGIVLAEKHKVGCPT
jgi:drug/metabolite transporter (DMT)-like permease